MENEEEQEILLDKGTTQVEVKYFQRNESGQEDKESAGEESSDSNNTSNDETHDEVDQTPEPPSQPEPPSTNKRPQMKRRLSFADEGGKSLVEVSDKSKEAITNKYITNK